MAGKIQHRTLPPTLESFGVAIDFLSRFPPFDTSALGGFSRVVRRQILAGEHVVVWDGENLKGYAGWLPTTKAAAEAWLADGGELRGAEKGHDAVALTVVAVEDPKLVLGIIRAARELNPGLRVFFKRSYGDEARTPRKSAVLNREPATRERSAVAPSAAARDVRRPAIADDPCGFLFDLAARAPGRTERVAVGEETVIVVQDPAVAAHVLVTHGANYSKNFASFSPLFGASRLTLDGDRWRQSQRVSQPFIAPHDVGRAEVILVERHTELAEALLAQAADGSAIDAVVDRAVIAALLEVAFTTNIDDFGASFATDLRTVIRYCAGRAWDLRGVPVVADAAASIAAEAATGRIRSAVAEVVDRRRSHPNDAKDALSALIDAADRFEENGEGAEVDLAGEIITLIVAGSDTTSAAIGWALSILAEHSGFQEHLRGEVLAAIGERAPALADVQRVASLQTFLDETLRMFPPVPILSRIANSDDAIDGHHVRAGDRMLVSVIGIHQNPAAWEAPREFRLERHETDAGSRASRKSVFMPFSSGPRICGGARFAQMEMGLALMLILQRCRLDLPAPLPLAFEWGASMRRLGGQRLRVRPLR